MNSPQIQPTTSPASVFLTYVVPTKDRPDDMAKLLDSMAIQSRLPDQIIVVDGSDPDIKHIVDRYPDLPITYVREFPPSLARQRNAGMASLQDGITIAGYLDDDIVLEADSTERMVKFWENAAADVGGAAFSIINQGESHRRWLTAFFRLDGTVPGQVLPSGCPVQIPFVENTIETEWLYGGATMWRRSVIEEFSFDEWFEGHGFLEDLDYSFRVSRNHKLFVIGDARVWHFSTEKSLDKQYEFGRQQIFNRLYFIRKQGCFPRHVVAWALFGILFLNTLALMRHLDRPRLNRLRGNLRGLIAALGRRHESFKGHWKD